MRRLLSFLAVAVVATLTTACHRGEAGHSSASPAPSTAVSGAPSAVPSKTATSKPPKGVASAISRARKVAGANEMRSIQVGSFCLQAPTDWIQTNTGTRREVAFGTRDGKLGVSVMVIPPDKAEKFLKVHSVNPLPGMTAVLQPSLSGRKTVNGLTVLTSGGTVGYGGGRRYDARFWVYRGPNGVLVLNAFDGIASYRKALDAMCASVQEVDRKATALTASEPNLWPPFSVLARRLSRYQTQN